MEIFFTLFIRPLLNLLIFFYNFPLIGLGGAIIFSTILIKILFLPFSLKFARFQKKFQDIQPKLEEIQKKYKKNNEALSRKTIELFKKEKVNPFTGFLSLLIQFPVILAFFFILKDSINLTGLYSFVNDPVIIDYTFLGFDLAAPNLLFAILVAFLVFVFSSITHSSNKKNKLKKTAFTQFLGKYMLYIMPVIMFLVGLFFSAALILYWIVNISFSIIERMYVDKKILKDSQP